MTPPRLSPATLGRLAPEIDRPAYARDRVRPGVVHLGLGAFHRAHQAVVFDELLSGGDLRWGVRGVSMRSAEVRDRLAPQAGLYTVIAREGREARARVIGAVGEVAVAPEAPAAVATWLADPETHLVTLTVTEKGYLIDPGSGEPDWDHPDIRQDLQTPRAPRTATGLLVEGLRLRRERGLAGLSVLSCDNLTSNGRRLGAAVTAFAARLDPGLADWIAAQAAFPNAMVDRIVPATTEDDLAAFAERWGVRDEAVVSTEPFLQWVIEDRFARARPDFERAGAQVVRDVEPFEAAKLRLLNGAHSTMAYLGGLMGLAHVHDAVADPALQAVVRRLWAETGSTLTPAPGLDLEPYQAQLLARWRNTALNHRLRQIACDGSQKLPQRLLRPFAERLARGQPASALALAIAAWMRWQAGRDDRREAIEPDDPASARLRAAYAAAGTPRARVLALLAEPSMAGFGLAQSGPAVERLAGWLELLEREGAQAAATACAAGLTSWSSSRPPDG